MRTRVIGALIALVAYLPFLILGGGYYALCMWVLGLIGLYEFAQMQKINFFNHIGLVSAVALTSILIPTHYAPSILHNFDPQYIFYVCCLLLLTFTVFNHKYFNIVNAAVLMFASIYIGYGFNFLILIRDMGLDTIFYLLMVIWSTDSGAYLIGKTFGRNLLAPAISPKKTIEGMVGGVATALLVSSLYVRIIQPNLGPVNHVWILTIVISLFGQFGDLVESAIKRHFKVKDSGNVIPGHGGILDRFDSTIFASFIVMIWINLFR